MKSKNHYFKVEAITSYEDYNLQEKFFFNEKEKAFELFDLKEELVKMSFTQGRINQYYVALAEVFKDEKRTVVHKLRKMPL